MSALAARYGAGTLAADAIRVAAFSRHEIREGRFQRTMAVIAAFSAVVSGFEAYIQHLRGAFSNRWMWTPVWLTPPTVLAAVVALLSERAARSVLPAVSLVSLADGLIGFAYHVRGVRRLPGGFGLGQYNVVMGPPIFAPLLTCVTGILGLLAALLRRERLSDPLSDRLRGQALVKAIPSRRHPWDSPQGIVENVAYGEFQRVLALVSAALAALAGGEAYFEHLRGSFNRRWMWTPVWVTPPMVVAAIAAAVSARVARLVLPFAAAVTFADGLVGFALHLRGIKRMPGGFSNLQFNITLGPPMFAPLLFCAVGLLGMIAAVLRRGEPA